MKKIVLSMSCAVAASVLAFDWPAGQDVTIPAGTVVEVTGNEAAAVAACGAITIEEGAMLSFTNVTASTTLPNTFSGAGKILGTMDDKSSTRRLTFTGDLENFTGSFEFNYLHATFNTAKSGTAPMTLKNNNKASFAFDGPYTYYNPLDISVGANFGVQVKSQATLAGDITVRGGKVSGESNATPGYGGTVTGNIYVDNSSLYLEDGIIMLGAKVERSAQGGSLIADGGPLDLKAKVINFSSLNTYRSVGVVRFFDENLLPDTTCIQFGTSYAGGGKIDLNGFDQRCKYITVNNTYSTPANTTITSSTGPATLTILNQNKVTAPVQLDGHVTLDYQSLSANTLLITGLVHKTDGKIKVGSGYLAFSAQTEFPNLSGIEVTGGELTLRCGDINKDRVEMLLAGTGVLKLDGDFTIYANRMQVDGNYLAADTYDSESAVMAGRLQGAGKIHVLNGAPHEEGESFVWIGAGADTLVTTADNWQGGEAPTFDGTERLIFDGTTVATATFTAAQKVYALEITGEAAFTLAAASEDACIEIGAGGIDVKPYKPDGTTKITHSFACPIKLDAIPQVWTIGTNTIVSQTGAWSGAAATPYDSLLIHSFGRLEFRVSNDELYTPMCITNSLTDAAKPMVYPSANPCGLGAATRPTTFVKSMPMFMNNISPYVITNDTPLRLANNVTGSGLRPFINNSGNYAVYLNGLVSYFGGIGGEVYAYARLHYCGGLIHEDSDKNITIRMAGGGGVYVDSSVNISGSLQVDYGGHLYMGGEANVYTQFNPYKCHVVCMSTGALCPSGTLTMSSSNGAYTGNSFLDLNGFNNSTAVFKQSSPRDEYYVQLTSATPACLNVESEEANNYSMNLRIEGQASLRYAKPGTLTLTNGTCTTTGTLTVDAGMVRIAAGESFTEKASVEVGANGTLQVTETAADTAFGTAAGQSRVVMTVHDGAAVSVAEGAETTVRAVVRIDENGVTHYLPRNVYTPQNSTFVTSGSVRTLSSAAPCTIITIR